MLQTRFKKTRCIFTEFISQTRYQNAFCYMQQSELSGVKQTRIYAILFNIVKLIFPYILRVCNAICVEYRFVYI